MKKLLVVCVGNICRSPVAAEMLRARLPDHEISSAGLSAVIGHDIDATAREVAEANGLVPRKHEARQFAPEIGERQDLILVLEAGHKREIVATAPQLSGRIFKLGHWTGGQDIPDPYGRSEEYHRIVFDQLEEGAKAWANKLSSANGT